MTNNQTSAYIVRNGEVIATCRTSLKNGVEISYSYERCKEALNADREFQLVNAKSAKISRAKKYEKQAAEVSDFAVAIETSEKISTEFFVS